MNKFVDIKGMEGMYQINMMGEIMGLRGRYGKCPAILKVKLGNNGYYAVSLCQKEGKRITISIHRLLAIMYIPNPDNKPFINHIDGIKTNNALSNLEWCTPKENLTHASKMGLLKGNTSHRKLYKEQRESIKNETGMSNKDIAIKYGVNPSYISTLRGAKTKYKRLTNSDVTKIKEMISQGIKQSKIAQSFNVNQSSISLIKNKKTWLVSQS